MNAPQPEVEFHHRTPVQFRFTDFDMFGHLNNTVYFTLMDTAKVDYFNTVSPRPIDWHDAGMVIVHTGADFYSPIFPNEKIEVLTAVIHIGEKSLTLEQRIVEIRTGDIKCIGRTVMAGFDIKTSTSIPIRDYWVKALSAYEKRQF